jgi:hypothetical protein
VLTDFCERVLDIEKMRSVCKAGRSNPGQPNRPLASNDRHDVTERNSLITILRRFRNRKATDPRDKVYALLSLVEENNDRPPLLPDYRLNDAEVYIRASLESIYSSGSLSVLSVDVARKYRQDLPSWVPDWDAPGDFSHNERIRTINLYNTSSKYPVNSDTVRLSGSELILSGRMIDFVSGVAGAMLSESNDTFRNILSNWIAYIVDNDDSISVVGLLGRKYVLWRLLCAEIVYAANYASDIPRRARASDELMFVTWTLLSRKSPFYDVYRIPDVQQKERNRHQKLVPQLRMLETYLSSRAVHWYRMLFFALLIDEKDYKSIGQEWTFLFPDEAFRREVLIKAIGRRMISGDRDLIEGATRSVKAIAESISNKHVTVLDDTGKQVELHVTSENATDATEDLQLQAWKRVPWDRLYAAVKPVLRERVDDNSGILELPYETHVSVMDRSVVSATKARRLFKAKSGRVRLGTADLVFGDGIHVIKGGNTPFVLRDETHPLKRRGPRHTRMLGDCYAFGLMDGDDVARACMRQDELCQRRLEEPCKEIYPIIPEDDHDCLDQWRDLHIS